MSGLEKHFIYCNAKGELSANSVYSASESEWYLQAIRVEDRVFRTYRKDRIIEEVPDSSDLAGRLEYHKREGTRPDIHAQPPRGAAGLSRSSNTLDICFTGFNKADKEKLAKLAEEAGMVVCKSVTVSLNFLCYGANAGPAKTEKARNQGVVILSAEQLEEMIKTGEIPE